jgi:hypothetical protein
MKGSAKDEIRMLFPALIRWGGLLAAVAAALYMISDLAALFFIFGQGSSMGVFLRNTLTVYARVPLLVGLVALYAYQFKLIGLAGLVGFLEAFVGTMLWPLYPVWPSVLASLGWILFGAVSLNAEVYSGAAVVLLIIGAALSGIANALIASGLLVGNPGFVTGVLIVDIIFYTATAWLGISLFTRSSREF